jgi:hypothetical protein
MGNLPGGIISGLIFGAVVVGMMLPMQFPDKTTALLAAFISRFGVGLVIACVQLPWPGWLIGVVFGLLLSIPDALITKAYAPILIVGTVGGAIIGSILHGWK